MLLNVDVSWERFSGAQAERRATRCTSRRARCASSCKTMRFEEDEHEERHPSDRWPYAPLDRTRDALDRIQTALRGLRVRYSDGGRAGRYRGSRSIAPRRSASKSDGHRMSDGLPTIDEALEDEVAQRAASTLLQGPDGPDGRALAAGGRQQHRALPPEARPHARAARRARRDHAARSCSASSSGDLIPSLRAVWIFATALEVPFGALVAYPGRPEVTFSVRRAGHGRIVASSDNGFRSRALSPLGQPSAPGSTRSRSRRAASKTPRRTRRARTRHLVVTSGTLVVSTGVGRDDARGRRRALLPRRRRASLRESGRGSDQCPSRHELRHAGPERRQHGPPERRETSPPTTSRR